MGAYLVAVYDIDHTTTDGTSHPAPALEGEGEGAYSVSSNRVGSSFGGGGWIFSPDGDLLARTDQQQQFATVALDLELANEAKTTHPRCALWDTD